MVKTLKLQKRQKPRTESRLLQNVHKYKKCDLNQLSGRHGFDKEGIN